MYYRLGGFGRFVWCLTAVSLWCYLTWRGIGLVFDFAGESGDSARKWTRSNGFNPIFADFQQMIMGLFAFLGVPFLTSSLIYWLHQKLKGVPHVPTGNHRVLGVERKLLPRPPRPLRALPKQPVRSVRGRRSLPAPSRPER